MSYATKVGTSYQLSVGEAYEASAGKRVVIDAGEAVEITAGKRLVLRVGNTRLQMDALGTIVAEGSVTTIVKGGAAQLTVGPGPILHVPNLVPGGAGVPNAPCLRRMSKAGAPFVRA